MSFLNDTVTYLLFQVLSLCQNSLFLCRWGKIFINFKLAYEIFWGSNFTISNYYQGFPIIGFKGYLFECYSGFQTACFYLSQDPRFSKILDNLRLQKRGTGGVDTAAVGSTFDISNLDRLGQSEVHTHTHTRAHTHARTHAHTHIRRV